MKKEVESNRSDVVIALSGGIGNQLFQLAYGLYLEKVHGFQLRYDCELGMPRTIGNTAALLSLSYSEQAKIVPLGKTTVGRILQKCYGWNLREALKGGIRRTPTVTMVSFITRALLQIRFGSGKKVYAAKNLGFDSSLPIENNSLYIGYFQTHKFASVPVVFETLMSIQPRNLGPNYYRLLELIRIERPILIHVRLTDYVSEKSFGIPAISYYMDALNSLKKEEMFSSAWVISDDTKGARVHLDKLSNSIELKFLDQSILNDLEVWALMRNFSAYVLSNSSFAWWAAFLREDRESKVYAPDPWFQGMCDPEFLLPTDWIRVCST